MKRFVFPVLGSLLAAFILGEVMLRVIGYSSAIWYRPDAQLGWTLRPGVAAWFTKEGRAWVEVNAAGQRDREHAVQKPAGVYRIAVLGDSYSEAMQVERDQAYWAQLPERLAACSFAPAKRIEVLNFGVSGYGTAQEYLVLETTAQRYQPDLVILQFTNGNDVQNNSPALDDEKSRPFYRLEAGGLVADNSFAASAAFQSRKSLKAEVGRRLSDYSRIVQLARATKEGGLISRAHATAAPGLEEGLARAPLAPPREAQWEEAWRVTEALIAQTGARARQLGAKFVLITVPYAIQVHPDPELRASFQKRLGVENLFYPDQRLAELGGRHGFQVVALAPHMQRMAEEGNRYFHGFQNSGMGRGHWNPEGHRVAADIVARHLCGRG
jgi:lysophospholipase L1-like esterase